VIFQGTRISYGNLTPLIPLSLTRRGGREEKEGLALLLNTPVKLASFKGEKEERGGLRPPLKTASPFP
jgi:hypothetical protein